MLVRAIIQTLAMLVVLAAILLGAGGDWLWPQAWAFLGETGVLSLCISVWLAQHDPELLKARLTSTFKADQRPFDRAVIIAIGPLYLAWLALIGLDAERFQWSSAPLPAQIAGTALVGLGMVLAWETFRQNSFAAPQVRVQAERGQTVIDTGVYRYIRHPMYAGALLYIVGAPLVMGSLWGLVGSAVLAIGFAVRAVGEETVLKADLPGYVDYMQKTPWRLIPGVW